MGSSEAGTSSGSEYQVFLNFRGPDTRDGFTDFLYHSLTDAGICVFRDDEELPIGERIDGALPRAIDNSGIYIPIFSRTYASSQWCLRELAQIMENASKSSGHKEILPIFFDVEPNDVKLKTPLYRDAILNLEREKNLSTEQVDSWREALKEVDAIKGWEVKKYKGQGELIKLVVDEVVKKLKTKQKSVTEHLIGIDDQVVAVKNLLDVGSRGGRLIQIHGMGGIGKTTLAKVVFNELSTHFGKRCCLLEDIREKSSRLDGLVELQKKLLSEIGSAAGIECIDAIEYGKKRIEETLCNTKVFIVLDDVDEREQVEKLVGTGTLCSGSRVLITTRNKDILQGSQLKYSILPYEMKMMSSDHALQLFSRHAFNKDSPPDDRYDISKEIVFATGSLPLTIVVIGSLLNHGTQDIWKETLDDLRKAPPGSVFEKLRISYKALTFEQQQIFLDIACFFIGEIMTNPIYMWTDCGFSPIRGIEVLKNKSLIKIVNDNEFWMHDQLEGLGREIVRQENRTIPEGRSRLWIQDEVHTTMKTKEMKKVQAMEVTHESEEIGSFKELLRLNGGSLLGYLEMKKVQAMEVTQKSICIKSEEIGRFKELRFLRLNGGTFVGDLMDCFPKLKWIYLRDSLFSQCELTNMCFKNVVVLEFSFVHGIDDQKLLQLIKGTTKLKVLSLAKCHGITRTPDLSECSKLERLAFFTCDGLTKIDGSIGKLKDLKDLKFDLCNRLEGLPEKIGDLRNLEHFSLRSCCAMKELPDFIFKWKSLQELQLSIACPVELPGAIGKFENLKVLQVEGHLKGQLPSEIGLLLSLQILELKGFDEIRELPDLSNLTNLVRLKLDDGSKKIDKGDRTYIGDLECIGGLSKLKSLSLCLLHVPAPCELASLQLDKLRLCGLNLQPLKQLPSSLLELTLDNFNSTTFLSSPLENLSILRLLRSQMQEIRLDGLQLPNLMELKISGYGPLERFVLSSMTKLENVKVERCPKLYEIHIAGVLESLYNLYIQGCESLRRFVYVDRHWESSLESSLVLALRVFNKLEKLSILSCNNILGIQVVDTLELLQTTAPYGCHLQSLGGLSKLKNFTGLHITFCPMLRIVEGLDKLEFLELLTLISNPLLESPIDVSTTELPNDCHLIISCCPKLLGLRTIFEGSVQDFKQYKDEDSLQAAIIDPLMVWLAHSSEQHRMHVQRMMAQYKAEDSLQAALTDPLMLWRAKSSEQERMHVQGMMAQYKDEESFEEALIDPLMVWLVQSSKQERMHVQGMMTQYEDEESLLAALIDALMVCPAQRSAQEWMHVQGMMAPFEDSESLQAALIDPLMVCPAQSSAQEWMHVQGMMAPFEDEESLQAALIDPLMVCPAQSSAQEWMHVQGMMAPFEDEESLQAALIDPLMVCPAQSSAQEWMHVQGMMAPFEDEESLQAALIDPLMVCPAQSSAQEWMHVQGMMAPFEDEESLQAALTHPLMVWPAQSSAQELMDVQEMMALFEEEESVPAASTDPLMVWHPPMVSLA